MKLNKNVGPNKHVGWYKIPIFVPILSKKTNFLGVFAKNY